MREGEKKTFEKKQALNLFLENSFLSREKTPVFSEIGNNPMRALGRKKPCCFGTALSKPSARAHLK